jgi:hypothetical protein
MGWPGVAGSSQFIWVLSAIAAYYQRVGAGYHSALVIASSVYAVCSGWIHLEKALSVTAKVLLTLSGKGKARVIPKKVARAFA